MKLIENEILMALRDFFLSRSGGDIAAAYTLLAADDSEAPDVDKIDWVEAEFAYNKLFVGPMALKAPPYASFYLESEPQLMGKSTLKIRRLYDMAGLTSPLQGSLPDDHLGVELDAAIGLMSMARHHDAEELIALWRYFFREHLNIWIPQFLKQARNTDTRHLTVDLALDRLEAWLNNQQSKKEGYDE